MPPTQPRIPGITPAQPTAQMSHSPGDGDTEPVTVNVLTGLAG